MSDAPEKKLKEKKPRTEAQLAILAEARKKALEVRKGNAELRAKEKDIVKAEKNKALDERKKKVADYHNPPPPPAPLEEEEYISEEAPPPKVKKVVYHNPPKVKKERKKKIVYVSDSDSEEEEEEEIVYVKKAKSKKPQRDPETGESRGLRIRALKKDSVFARQGLQEDDVLLSVNGVPAKSQADLMRQLRTMAATDTIQIQFERAGAIRSQSYRLPRP